MLKKILLIMENWHRDISKEVISNEMLHPNPASLFYLILLQIPKVYLVLLES